jgi:phage FluMu gp28-like protein
MTTERPSRPAASTPPASPSLPATVRPIVPLLPYQREDIEADDRFRWNCWSRQTGKSFTKSLRRILRGLQRRRNQIFLSAGERQSVELMQKARQHCQALQIAADFHDHRTFRGLSVKQLEIHLPGGVRIVGLPANPLTARGFTGDVLLDEFAMHAADRDIWASIFPTVLRGDGELDIASTPKGHSNMFYDLRDNPRFVTSTVTLLDAIAQGLPADAAEMRAAMGDDELYRQEFLCEFLDEATAFLTYEQIAACCDPTLTLAGSTADLAATPGELFAGVDIGRVRDLTVFWVFQSRDSMERSVSPGTQRPLISCAAQNCDSMERSVSLGTQRPLISCAAQNCDSTERSTVLTTVAMFELPNTPFAEQFDRLCELLSLPNLRRCCIDAGGLGMMLAEQAVDRFGPHRVAPVTFTTAIKSQLAGALRVEVEARRLRIPVDERIRNDWHSVERTMTETGHFRLAAPRKEGSHADRFWAAALALHAASGATGPVESLSANPLRFAREGAW